MDMTSRDSRSKGILTISLLFLAMTWPVILSGRGGTNEASDEVHYHLPMIQHFAEQWPLPPEDDAYTSATTPGYHYLMAGVDRGLSVLTGSGVEAVPGEGLAEDPAAAGTVTGQLAARMSIACFCFVSSAACSASASCCRSSSLRSMRSAVELRPVSSCPCSGAPISSARPSG